MFYKALLRSKLKCGSAFFTVMLQNYCFHSQTTSRTNLYDCAQMRSSPLLSQPYWPKLKFYLFPFTVRFQAPFLQENAAFYSFSSMEKNWRFSMSKLPLICFATRKLKPFRRHIIHSSVDALKKLTFPLHFLQIPLHRFLTNTTQPSPLRTSTIHLSMII